MTAGYLIWTLGIRGDPVPSRQPHRYDPGSDNASWRRALFLAEHPLSEAEMRESLSALAARYPPPVRETEKEDVR
jgi:hypothetical protein